MVITEVPVSGYERVVHFTDEDFSAYIALHNTRRGAALGGCRVKQYSSDQDALLDALDLSKAMSYKNSLADLWYGGGKCVVNAPESTPDLMRKVGEAVAELHGEYFTAEDMGTTMDDMRMIREVTPYVVYEKDGSPWTALGVYTCITRMFTEFDMWSVNDPSVWIQGLGKVGWLLMERLHAHGGMRLLVSDIVSERVEKAIDDFEVIPVMDSLPSADLYAPCAIGRVVSEDNAKRLPPIICGAANNQLDFDEAEAMSAWLEHNGIIYCPDFLVNAGGVIAASAELNGHDDERLERDVKAIADRLMEMFHFSEQENRDTLATAMMWAEQRWL